MTVRATMIGLLIASMMVLPTAVLADSSGDTAAKAYAQGTDLLKKADFDGALKAYAIAARDSADNTEYRDQYMLLRRVTKMREAITKEENPKKWMQLAAALRSFYYSNELYEEVLKLARQMNEKEKTIDTAVVLADAYLALGQNPEAEKALGTLDRKALTPQAQALYGIALARQKKADEAKTVLGEIAVPEKASPRLLLDLARLKVACGDVQGGISSLTTAFESTPPSALPSIKAYAAKSVEFEALAKSDQFNKALNTDSKVKESSCSGGSDCGSCPSRGKCPSGGAGGASCAKPTCEK
jgi:tetratricopeptide (TPR) repeat protein